MCLLRSLAKVDHFLPDLGFLGVLAPPPFFSAALTSLSQTSHTQRPVETVEQQTDVKTQSVLVVHNVYDLHCRAHLSVWCPSPRRTCGSLGRICRRTSSRPHGGAADRRCRSYTPYTASCTSGSHTPARCSCPSRMGGLKFTHMDLHAQKQTHVNKVWDVKMCMWHTHFPKPTSVFTQFKFSLALFSEQTHRGRWGLLADGLLWQTDSPSLLLL